MEKSDRLKGKITASSPIDIYFVSKTNFKKWNKGEEFHSEDCSESFVKGTIDYEVPRSGTWYLIIENNGRKTAQVKVVLY